MSDTPSERELIEALRYPTSIIRTEIDLSQCRNSGGFQREDEECITCYQTPECEWLFLYDNPDKRQQLDFNQLLVALRFAADYMHARLSLKRHLPKECPCEACAWWRSSQTILAKASLREKQTA